MSAQNPSALFNHPAWRSFAQGAQQREGAEEGDEHGSIAEADAKHAILCAGSGDWKPLLDLASVHGFIVGYDREPPKKNSKSSSALSAFKNFADSIESSRPLVFQAIEATSNPREATESLLACCPPDATPDFCSLLLSISEPSMFDQGPEAPIIELIAAKADRDKSAQAIFDNALACAETAQLEPLRAYLTADLQMRLFSPEQKSNLLLEALRKERAFSSSDKMKCADLLLDFGASLWDNPGCQNLSLIEQAAEDQFDLNWNYICESKIPPQQLGYAPGGAGDLLCQRLADKISQAKDEAQSPKAEEDDDVFSTFSSPYLDIQARTQEYPWHGACLDWMLLRAQMRDAPTTPKTIKHL